MVESLKDILTHFGLKKPEKSRSINNDYFSADYIAEAIAANLTTQKVWVVIEKIVR